MTEFSLRRYVAGDVRLITPRATVAHEYQAMDSALVDGALPIGLAWTLQAAGAPIGCGGLFEVAAGRWAAWTWMGEVPFAARKKVFRACLGGIERVRRQGARRIESHVPVTMPLARRFNEKLGFVCEGVARAWGPDGGDYWHMALVLQEVG